MNHMTRIGITNSSGAYSSSSNNSAANSAAFDGVPGTSDICNNSNNSYVPLSAFLSGASSTTSSLTR